MAMNVRVLSKEIIKPSSPTPDHQKTYNLCLLDQLCPPLYIPVVIFYSATVQEFSEKSNILKKSLSETLTHFYPFAGRMKDDLSVDCNDHGADYIEVSVACDMSMVLKQPDTDKLEQLLPCHPYVKSDDYSTLPILTIKVNHFECGGMAIGVSVWHVVADASAMANFVKSWAAVARGANDTIDSVVIDCTSLFPTLDLGSSIGGYLNEELFSKIVTKRFLFDKSKIAALKKMVANGPNLDSPTRVEAISALIWGAVIPETQENFQSDDVKIHVAVNMINLRKRLNPPLPPLCIGNINQMTQAIWPTNKAVDYNDLAGRLSQSIRKINDDYVKKLYADNGYLNFIKSSIEEHAKGSMVGVFTFSSWCRFPFYETDFGWGKPICFIPGQRVVSNLAYFVDTADGEGIETWITLSKEDMAKFEQNPGILEYATFDPSI